MNMRKCYICRQKRPADRISSWHKQLFFNGIYMGNMILAYCNDNADCVQAAGLAMAENGLKNGSQLSVQSRVY